MPVILPIVRMTPARGDSQHEWQNSGDAFGRPIDAASALFPRLVASLAQHFAHGVGDDFRQIRPQGSNLMFEAVEAAIVLVQTPAYLAEALLGPLLKSEQILVHRPKLLGQEPERALQFTPTAL